MVGLQSLDLPIGVRIPASQSFKLAVSSGSWQFLSDKPKAYCQLPTAAAY